MKIKRNGKIIGTVDRRFNDKRVVMGKDPRIGKKRTRKHFKGNQRGIKVLFACSLVPMFALFCTGCVETRDAMNEKTEVVEEVPDPIKFEEMSVVEKSDSTESQLRVTESIEDMIKRIFPEDYELATAIFKAESGLNPNAKGDTNTKYPSIGIAQIRLLPERGLNEQELYNPEYNLEYARMLKDKSGWTPWSCYKNGSYKKFIK